jgi:hypothetical protein
MSALSGYGHRTHNRKSYAMVQKMNAPRSRIQQSMTKTTIALTVASTFGRTTGCEYITHNATAWERKIMKWWNNEGSDMKSWNENGELWKWNIKIHTNYGVRISNSLCYRVRVNNDGTEKASYRLCEMMRRTVMMTLKVTSIITGEVGVGGRVIWEDKYNQNVIISCKIKYHTKAIILQHEKSSPLSFPTPPFPGIVIPVCRITNGGCGR